MRAVILEKFGGPDGLVDGTLPTPHVGPHDLLIRVKAVGFNPTDYQLRQHGHPDLKPPIVLGWPSVTRMPTPLEAAASEPANACSAPGPIDVTTAGISPYCQRKAVAACAIATSFRQLKGRVAPSSS